jgi:hypothetical protein
LSIAPAGSLSSIKSGISKSSITWATEKPEKAKNIIKNKVNFFMTADH